MNHKPAAASRRGFLLTCGTLTAAAAVGGCSSSRATSSAKPPASAGELKPFQRKSRAMGSDISMLVLHEDPAVGNRALDAAFAELARVENVMSIYLPNSQLSLLNKNGFLKNPDPYLVEVLHHSQDMARKSDGAFDITVQPLWVLYAAAQKQNALPSDAAIDVARSTVDYRNISISDSEIRLQKPNMAITLNGIAQGFAADKAMAAIKQNGIKHALVNAGEISSLGKKASGDPWVVGIQHPRQPDAYLGLAKIDGRCISTSGDYETAFTPDKAYNHIFEPSTGRSPLELSSVTIVAPNATLADALSTAIFVLGTEKGLALAHSLADIDAVLVTKSGRQFATKGFPWNV